MSEAETPRYPRHPAASRAFERSKKSSWRTTKPRRKVNT
jgi:hypothetical protein